MARQKSGVVQVLERAMAILNLLSDAGEPLPLTEIVHRSGLPASTAHRLLTSLETQRFVRFDKSRRTWSVGIQAFIAGTAFLRNRDIVAIAKPYMEKLVEAWGETVNLATADDGMAVYLAQVPCAHMMRSFARLGARVPLPHSGVGKAILAAGAANRSATADVTITPMTPRSLTSHRDLAADLARTRCRGYAVDDEEHALGLRCVAAPVLDVDGAPLCAISISGPTLRMDAARVEAMGADVRRVAGLVTREVGGAQNRSGNSR